MSTLICIYTGCVNKVRNALLTFIFFFTIFLPNFVKFTIYNSRLNIFSILVSVCLSDDMFVCFFPTLCRCSFFVVSLIFKGAEKEIIGLFVNFIS